MKRYVYFLLAFIFVGNLNAQDSPKKVDVYLPKVLLSKLVYSKDLATINSSNNWGQNAKTGKFWDVYSDRSENAVYKDASITSAKVGELSMGEPVRIAEIKNNMAHVYHESQSPTWPDILTPVWKGWVPMENLLLWDNCPVDEKGIYNKALIVVNLGKTKAENMQDILAIYTHPGKNTKIGFAVSNINFKFIMKSDKKNKRVLLATQYKITRDGGGFYGWVDEQSYVPWNQRSCLEPNWNQEMVKYFNNKGEKLSVYERGDLKDEVTKPFRYGEIQNKDYQKPAEKYRMSKGSLRYPILDKDDQVNDNIYHCNVFANPENGNITDAAKYNDEIVRLQNSAIKSVESVNLVIAIDGTSSMGNYYPAVREAIKKGYGYYKDRNFNVKIGLVIYRDYSDGEALTEYLSLRPHTDPSIDKFLQDGGNIGYGIKSSPRDKTYEEALYAGLMVATDKEKMKFGEKESNLLLVVGDCGNDLRDKKFSQSEVVNRLVQNNFQVISFQVRRKNEIPFNLYGSQMREIIKANISRQIERLAQKPEDIEKMKVDFKKTSDGFELGDLALNYYIGSLLQPNNGQDMPTQRLSEYIIDKLGKYSEAIQRQRQVIQMPNLAGNTKDSTEARLTRAFIEERVGKDYVDALIKSNSILSTEGYTPKQDMSGHDYWKTVIYISKEELTKLLDQLSPLNKAAKESSYDNRTPYITAVKGLIRSMIPEFGNDEERMGKMTTEEVMKVVYGLNATTKTLKGQYTLQDIQNPKIVDNQTYASIINEFAEKYKNLQDINKSYEFKLQVNQTTYYWIPTDQLP